jgi:hypothetical protein
MPTQFQEETMHRALDELKRVAVDLRGRGWPADIVVDWNESTHDYTADLRIRIPDPTFVPQEVEPPLREAPAPIADLQELIDGVGYHPG